jgi:hypothetical protein
MSEIEILVEIERCRAEAGAPASRKEAGFGYSGICDRGACRVDAHREQAGWRLISGD